MAEFYSRELKRSFEIDEQDKDKYLVLTCAKNENDYIIEWVEHYLNLGFDKIIIADNNDLGDESLFLLLQDYINKNQVQVWDCRGIGAVQIPLYSDFCEFSNYKWCAYFDCDEFLEINNYTNIKDYLNTLNGCDCLCINWLMYGPNGQYHKENGTVQERFPKPLSPILYFKENCFVKSIVRGGNKDLFKDCWFNGSHLPYTNNNTICYSLGGEKFVYSSRLIHAHYPFCYKNLYLKHYYTKSFDEWIQKSSRGWPDNTPTLKTSNYFLFNENLSIPTKFLSEGLFNKSDFQKEWGEKIKDFKYILIEENNMFIYPFLGDLVKLFELYSDKVYAIINTNIDDSAFNILFEYAIITGNKLTHCNNMEEFWNLYSKYPSNNDSFYKITFQ